MHSITRGRLSVTKTQHYWGYQHQVTDAHRWWGHQFQLYISSEVSRDPYQRQAHGMKEVFSQEFLTSHGSSDMTAVRSCSSDTLFTQFSELSAQFQRKGQIDSRHFPSGKGDPQIFRTSQRLSTVSLKYKHWWPGLVFNFSQTGWFAIKGTVSPDYKCLEVISIKRPLLGHVTPDIKKILNSSLNF